MLEFMLVLCLDTSGCEVTHVVLVLCFPWVSHDARHLTSCVYQIRVVPVLCLSLILNDVSIVCSLFISENSCCDRNCIETYSGETIEVALSPS